MYTHTHTSFFGLKSVKFFGQRRKFGKTKVVEQKVFVFFYFLCEGPIYDPPGEKHVLHDPVH